MRPSQTPLAEFLRTLPRLLASAPAPRRHGRGGRTKQQPKGRMRSGSSLPARALARLHVRLDCDVRGNSRRSGELAWPESMPTAEDLGRWLGADWALVLILASWLESRSPTTRRTYATHIRAALGELRVYDAHELVVLPEEAALAWQRAKARESLPSGAPRRPRSINTATAALNSLCAYVARLGIEGAKTWTRIPPVPLTSGRHIDVDPVVLSPEQLECFWRIASRRGLRQFLGLMIASLHGLRACEVARLTWGDLRHQRRGNAPAPAVLRILGKRSKVRMVQVHPALRSTMERMRTGLSGDLPILADESGRAPSPQTVSWWAKDVFRRMEMPGYCHALRATWTTLALEHPDNNAMQVQQSGGWRDASTMIGHYFKRRNIPAIHLVKKHGRF